VKVAEERMCTCDDTLQELKHHVFLGVLKLENHELESLDCFYCPKCNSTWKEA
jgi:hypothetical protein